MKHEHELASAIKMLEIRINFEIWQDKQYLCERGREMNN